MHTKIQVIAKALDNYYNAKSNKKEHTIEDTTYYIDLYKECCKTIDDLLTLAETCETDIKHFIEGEVDYYYDLYCYDNDIENTHQFEHTADKTDEDFELFLQAHEVEFADKKGCRLRTCFPTDSWQYEIV